MWLELLVRGKIWFKKINGTKLRKKTKKGEIKTRKRLNQEVSFQRPDKTCWGFDYMTFLRLVDLSASITKVLEYAEIDESDGIIIGVLII